jgi:hypothetical protein
MTTGAILHMFTEGAILHMFTEIDVYTWCDASWIKNIKKKELFKGQLNSGHNLLSIYSPNFSLYFFLSKLVRYFCKTH